MRQFGRVLGAYGKIELAVAVLAFAVSMALVVAQVLARQMGFSLWWAQEAAQLAIMYAYFLGVSHLYQVRHMVVVDFAFARMPPVLRVRVYQLGLIAVIVFCSLVLSGVIDVYRLEMRFPSFVLQVPRFYWTLPLGIASASMIATSLYFLINSLNRKAWGTDLGNVNAFEDRHAFARSEHDY